MDRIRELTLFLNPTDASYARLGNSTAPDRVSWSSAAESELMYIETYKGRTSVELRSPDASSNPYLVYALLIYAGLEGIQNRKELPGEKEGQGVLLPGSRREAVELARGSQFVKDRIPEGILKEYVKG